jgi:ribosomal protein L37E
MKYDLSVVIVARNEMFLNNTIEDVLKNKRGNTQIIVGLDGSWPTEPIKNHPDVVVLFYPESIGQRAIANRCVDISRARFIMKLDAHCAFDEGFDIKMMNDMKDDWTMAPTMRNLWVFDWKCRKCGIRTYQGPTPTKCSKCGGERFKRRMVWSGKTNPQSNSYCFDSEPHFQYFKDFSKRPEGKGDLTETMSLQGSCFMITRDRWLDLNICDEAFGSWGSQGIEVAAKSWLSGGKVMVNHKTWYAHLFRTSGGDFGFPYEMSHKQQEYAKQYARDLFFNNKWPKQIYPLSWLVEKFWPVPGWTEGDLNKLKERN